MVSRGSLSEIAWGVNYDEWEARLPTAAKSDPVWFVQAYRLGLFMSACARADILALQNDGLTASTRDQVLRAADSIAANVGEGYARRGAPDRLRFFEYALGSVYELRSYYLGALLSLPQGSLQSRIDHLLSLTRLLLTMVTRERTRATPRKAPS